MPFLYLLIMGAIHKVTGWQNFIPRKSGGEAIETSYSDDNSSSPKLLQTNLPPGVLLWLLTILHRRHWPKIPDDESSGLDLIVDNFFISTIRVCSPRTWNSLPDRLRSLEPFPTFCSHLKTHLGIFREMSRQLIARASDSHWNVIFRAV